MVQGSGQLAHCLGQGQVGHGLGVRCHGPVGFGQVAHGSLGGGGVRSGGSETDPPLPTEQNE